MRAIFAILATILLAAPAAAQQARPMGVPAPGTPQPMTTQQMLDVVFTEIEKRTIGDYYTRRRADEDREAARIQVNQGKGKDKGLPPGLAKRETLPPGLQMQLERHGTLPPGLAKRDLPGDLDRLLPRPRQGTQRIVVGNDVLLVQAATGVILDILLGGAGGGR